MMKNVGSIVEEKLSLTKEKYTFTWVIKNFQSYSNEVGGYQESPHFYSSANNEKYEWSLDLYLAGIDESNNDYIGIRVYLYNPSKHNNSNFTVKCSILDKNGKKCLPKVVFVKDESNFIPQFISRKNLLNKAELLSNNELRIVCEIFDFSDTCEEIEVQSYQNMHLNVFKALFDTKKCSDFKLVVKGKEFFVHRAILAVQSPVFEAMFESNMRESNEGEAHIDDIEIEVMEKLLRFVYIGQVDVENLVDKVLGAADKYQLDFLKSHCGNVLFKELNVDNVYDILLLADRNNVPDLKKKAIAFFNAHSEELVTAHNFKTSIDTLPRELLTDIIAASALKG